MNKLDEYLTKSKEERTWKDHVADAALAVFLTGAAALLFCWRHGII